VENFKPQNVDNENDIDLDNYSYRVALFRDVNTNGSAMHWLRQNADGTWSHKLGYESPVSNEDACGNLIYSPLTCNMDYSNSNHSNYSYNYRYNYEYVATFLIKTIETEY